MQFEERASSSTFTPSVPNGTLVYSLDIFVLTIILFFFLFNVPRALVYIANNRSEAFQGYLLRSATQLRMYRSPSGTMPQSKEKGPLENSISTPESDATPKQLWHLPMYFELRNFAASFMQYRILGNYTVVQVLLIALYTAAVFYAAFYESNPFTSPHRAGWVIVSQIPFVYAFATKNNVIGLLVGVGYEKVRNQNQFKLTAFGLTLYPAQLSSPSYRTLDGDWGKCPCHRL